MWASERCELTLTVECEYSWSSFISFMQFQLLWPLTAVTLKPLLSEPCSSLSPVVVQWCLESCGVCRCMTLRYQFCHGLSSLPTTSIKCFAECLTIVQPYLTWRSTTTTTITTSITWVPNVFHRIFLPYNWLTLPIMCIYIIYTTYIIDAIWLGPQEFFNWSRNCQFHSWLPSSLDLFCGEHSHSSVSSFRLCFCFIWWNTARR